MRRRWRVLFALAALILVVAVPLLYAGRNADLRNFRVVEDGVLYRSGQLTPEGFERVLTEYRIKTVVTLRTTRDPARPFPDGWEKDVCDARGLKHVRIVPRLWVPNEAGEIPAAQAVREFLAVMDDPSNYPVLVHCFAGIHRTGAMCAVFRMEYNGWAPEAAITEMRRFGVEPGEGHEVVDYLRSYRPRREVNPGRP